MEMIKAGPERDKVIAIKRGELKCIHDKRPKGLPPQANIADMCDGNSIAWPTHCYEGACLMWGIKPCSTSIVHAMELDLPTNNYEITRRGNKVKAACWVTLKPEGIHHESEWHETEAEAIADARTGAYLKWRSDA